MLVLTRKVGEKIVIDNDIHVVVVGIRGNQVRLGFAAPPEVSIQRPEIMERAEGARPFKAAERQLYTASGQGA